MSMTTEERKAWAVGLLDRWLRDHEEAQFFSAIDELRNAVDDLKACHNLDPEAGHDHLKDSDEPCTCPEYLFGGEWVDRTLDELTEVIDQTAVAFTRKAS